MGLKVAIISRKDGWTEQQDNFLRKLYTDGKQQEISKLLPTRTWKAIRRRAKQLGLYRGNYVPILRRLPTFTLTTIEATWLACAIDCEGSIFMNAGALKQHLLPVVTFCNTNAKIVEYFKQLTFPYISITKLVRPPNKTKYQVSIARMPWVYVFLKAIQNYLLVKYKQAHLVLEFLEIENERLEQHKKYGNHYTDRQLKIYEEIRYLNKRGV